jgi:enoyl-CoA hydratase/carnithine racemase
VSGLGPWTLERQGPLAVLTVDRPPLNLWDGELFAGLEAAIGRLRDEPARALLLRAEGRVFTAGIDVHEFEGLTPETGGELWRRGLATVQTLEELPFPTVFAAHGLCLTWGFEVALACDLIVAAESARFGLVEVVVGLTPSLGGPQRLAEKAGSTRAKQLVLTGDLHDAATLERWGVVAHVWPDDAFAERAHALATRLADGPTLAHAATKRLIAAQRDGGVRAADAVVPEVSGALFATEDLQGAVASFLAEGPGRATFRGR